MAQTHVAANGFTVRHQRLTDTATLATTWQQLEQDANATVFLSWQWLGTWLYSYALPVIVLEVIDAQQQVVGLGLLLERNTTRHGILNSRCLYLQQSGIAALDQVWIEYNGFLCKPALKEAVEQAAVNYIAKCLDWDEWVLGGVELTTAQRFTTLLGLKSITTWQSPCYGVDLKKLRQRNKPYLASLSANTRYQITRSLKSYQQYGAVQLQRPASNSEALVFFTEIGPLHIARWGNSASPSGFLNPEFVRFHQNMIKAHWPLSVDIIRVVAGEQHIATYYNLVYNNRAYFYLGGINFVADNKLKPGLLAHALIIEDYAAAGLMYYDFMGGNERYKAQLGEKHNELTQIALQRHHFKFWLENLARTIKHKFVKLTRSIMQSSTSKRKN